MEPLPPQPHAEPRRLRAGDAQVVLQQRQCNFPHPRFVLLGDHPGWRWWALAPSVGSVRVVGAGLICW
jgi:hypothetical protein